MSDSNQATGQRILTLDVTRGVAVMGIFSVNVVAMAMIQIAYFYPPAFGFDHLSDKLMWLANFILIDGKLRSLFSIMFGASTMLIVDRAIAAARSPWKTHYARMIVLMGFGFLHFLLLWWGDILTHYAAVGMLAFLFFKLRAHTLFVISVLGFLLYAGPSAYFSTKGIAMYEQVQAGTATPEMRKDYDERIKDILPDAKTIAEDKAAHQTIPTHVRAAIDEGLATPFDLGPLWIETLSLMLLGMAGYKSGFLTGEWDRARYRKVAIAGIGLGLVGYSGFAAWSWLHDFAPPYAMTAYGGYSPLLRPIMACGYAALVIMMVRPGGWLVQRVAAVGRTAFSNYLGCTIIGTLVFYGFGGGLYAEVSRSQAWLLVPPVWLLMLAWSKPWLERFHYGPFEWAWRSLARGKLQPMRKHAAIAEPASVGA
jgi:uncharacterized protein